MLHELAQILVNLIFDWGYLGIFIMMVIESSFIPFPSEIVLIPAGYLASQGEMSIAMIMLSALGGSMVGAFINYYLALTLGRNIIIKYGKYFFIKVESLEKIENFFVKHGHISTFTGRLIPGIRQLISVPAGLARMNLAQFSLFTALGAGIWALVLTLLGFYIGENEKLINTYLREITITVLLCLVIIVGVYYTIKKKRNK